MRPLKLERIVHDTFRLYQTHFLFRSLRLGSNSQGRKTVCVNACQGLNLANQMNLALTAPIVTQPVKLPSADLTRSMDGTLSNQRECLVPACLQWAARDSGVGLEPSQGKRANYDQNKLKQRI